MIDSHTHLFLCERPEAELVADARAAGVSRILNVGLGGEENGAAIGAAERHEAVFASVGCHPTEATGFDDARAEEIARLAAHEKVRGRPNEPAYVVDTAGVVAATRGIPYEELEGIVEANARALFGW